MGPAVNQTNQVQILRHRRQLAADRLDGEHNSLFFHARHHEIQQDRRTMNFQRTANSVLTVYLTKRGNRSLINRGINARTAFGQPANVGSEFAIEGPRAVLRELGADNKSFWAVGAATIRREVLQQKNSIHHQHADIGTTTSTWSCAWPHREDLLRSSPEWKFETKTGVGGLFIQLQCAAVF
jgi:hypothetical protein